MKEYIERVDCHSNTEEMNVNILFNLIQKCRQDCSSIRFNRKDWTKKILDTDLVQVTEGLLDEVKDVFKTFYDDEN